MCSSFVIGSYLWSWKSFLLRLYIGVYSVALSFPRFVVILLLYNILRGTGLCFVFFFPFFNYFSFSTPFLLPAFFNLGSAETLASTVTLLGCCTSWVTLWAWGPYLPAPCFTVFSPGPSWPCLLPFIPSATALSGVTQCRERALDWKLKFSFCLLVVLSSWAGNFPFEPLVSKL